MARKNLGVMSAGRGILRLQRRDSGQVTDHQAEEVLERKGVSTGENPLVSDLWTSGLGESPGCEEDGSSSSTLGICSWDAGYSLRTRRAPHPTPDHSPVLPQPS